MLAVNGGTAEVEAADGGRVTVRVNSGSPLEPNVVYQFLGKANSATDFSESKTVAWGAIGAYLAGILMKLAPPHFILY